MRQSIISLHYSDKMLFQYSSNMLTNKLLIKNSKTATSFYNNRSSTNKRRARYIKTSYICRTAKLLSLRLVMDVQTSILLLTRQSLCNLFHKLGPDHRIRKSVMVKVSLSSQCCNHLPKHRSHNYLRILLPVFTSHRKDKENQAQVAVQTSSSKV